MPLQGLVAAKTRMLLRALNIERVRSLRKVEMTPAIGLNLISGPNGSGKSSFLEAIYLLGLGRSFRSRSVREVITRGERDLLVHGRVDDESGRCHSLGIEKTRSRTRIRISGQNVSASSELARRLPLLLITPESQRLLTDGTRLRRRMLDWALFHVEPSYLNVWQRYRQTVRQRNAQLRRGGSRDALRVWDAELETSGRAMHEMRVKYVEEATPGLDELVGRLLGHEVTFQYLPGWDTNLELPVAVDRSLESDRVRGHTGVGPHRADLKFLAAGTPAQNVLSRGEGKLFVAAVLLAQARYVMQRSGLVPVVLIDDLASELDTTNRASLMSALEAVRAQTFLTAVSGDVLDTQHWQGHKMFHVEQGTVREVV